MYLKIYPVSFPCGLLHDICWYALNTGFELNWVIHVFIILSGLIFF